MNNFGIPSQFCIQNWEFRNSDILVLFSKISIIYKFLLFLKYNFYIIKDLRKNRTKNEQFRNAYKMGRPSIRVKLTITSKDDDQFPVLRTFNSIPDASSATGLTDRGIRIAYHSERESM